MSAVLQCLIHCAPLQQFFLRDIGHNHTSCSIYRNMVVSLARENGSASSKNMMRQASICLACEMDKMILQYLGSCLGNNVLAAVSDEQNGPDTAASLLTSFADHSKLEDDHVVQGDPLVTAGMLIAAWKMDHLAGYEQRDAHEFLHGFLDMLGKQMQLYRERVREAISMALDVDDAMLSQKEKKIHHGRLFR
jgi:ubiquitin carboxyl-terminal hydrolase 22/27/51